MCGRYVSATPPDQLAQYFGAESIDRVAGCGGHADTANYNVAPTQGVYTVYETRRGAPTRHVPLGARAVLGEGPEDRLEDDQRPRRDPRREELASSGPSPRSRCIIPADGFYEWKKVEGQKRKQPMYMTTIDDSPFAFAGLWEVWKDKNNVDDEGEPLELLQLHDHHRGTQREGRRGPRPHAGHAAARRVGCLARPRQPRHRRAAASCSCPSPVGLDPDCGRCRPTSTTSATTDPHLTDEAEPVTDEG